MNTNSVGVLLCVSICISAVRPEAYSGPRYEVMYHSKHVVDHGAAKSTGYGDSATSSHGYAPANTKTSHVTTVYQPQMSAYGSSVEGKQVSSYGSSMGGKHMSGYGSSMGSKQVSSYGSSMGGKYMSGYGSSMDGKHVSSYGSSMDGKHMSGYGKTETVHVKEVPVSQSHYDQATSSDYGHGSAAGYGTKYSSVVETTSAKGHSGKYGPSTTQQVVYTTQKGGDYAPSYKGGQAMSHGYGGSAKVMSSGPVKYVQVHETKYAPSYGVGKQSGGYTPYGKSASSVVYETKSVSGGKGAGYMSKPTVTYETQHVSSGPSSGMKYGAGKTTKYVTVEKSGYGGKGGAVSSSKNGGYGAKQGHGYHGMRHGGPGGYGGEKRVVVHHMSYGPSSRGHGGMRKSQLTNYGKGKGMYDQPKMMRHGGRGGYGHGNRGPRYDDHLYMDRGSHGYGGYGDDMGYDGYGRGYDDYADDYGYYDDHIDRMIDQYMASKDSYAKALFDDGYGDDYDDGYYGDDKDSDSAIYDMYKPISDYTSLLAGY